MKTIYLSIRGNPTGGGPSVFCHKFTNEVQKRGWKITYDNPNVDVALCIINTGKVLKRVGPKTKVILRIDGIYNKEYNEKFNRAITQDMIGLHEELKRDLPKVYTVFQSQWSRDRIFDEIVKTNNYSIIHNGCDINYFRPTARNADGFINLITVGKMRNGYFMETLLGTYHELKRRNKKVRLFLAGSMDKECQDVYNKKKDDNIILLGSFPNNQLLQAYSRGDIFLAPRQGSSSDNVISEAQACGLPVVCARWSGNSEMIVNKQTGIVVDGGHWDYDQNYTNNIATAIEEIIEDLSNYKKQARIHAINELSLTKMVDKYLEIM